MSGALPGSPLHTLDTDRIPISRESGEIGATGKPDARPGAPTAPFDSTPDQSPSPRAEPSPPSSTRHPTHPTATNDHPGLGAARSRTIRSRIAANDARGTATSANWNVTALAWRTTLAPILISLSRSVVSVQVRTGRGSANSRKKFPRL